MKFMIWQFLIAMQLTLLTSGAATTRRPTVDLPMQKCRDMPKITRMNLIQCCSVSEVFKADVKEKCVADCSDPDYKMNPWCCMTKCIMEETEIGSNGTVDRLKIKALFRAIFNTTSNQKIADSAVDKCDNDATPPDSQTEECEFPEYAILLTCVSNEIFKSCPYTVNDPICLQIKNFLRKCPSRRNDLFNV